MPYAITTEYRGPGRSSGSRIIVRKNADTKNAWGTIVNKVPYDYALDVKANHEAAAASVIPGGKLPEGTVSALIPPGYVFIIPDEA